MNSVEKIVISVISEENLNLLIKEYRVHNFRKGYTFGPHQHSWVEINYIKKGSCVMSFDDESICFKENECMIVYPEVKHSFNVNNIKGCTLVQLEFNMIIFPELAGSVSEMEKSLSFLYNYITHSSRFVKIVNNKSISSAMERIIAELGENNGEESLLSRTFFPNRTNLNNTLKRKGFKKVAVDFVFCESQIQDFKNKFGHDDFESFFEMSHRPVELEVKRNFKNGHELFHREQLPQDTKFDEYGIGHSKGSELAFHMTRMHHPLKGADLNEIIDYSYPSVNEIGIQNLNKVVAELHAKDLAAFGFMQMTVWEASWYLRSMEELMIDMMLEDEKATALLDSITNFACAKAKAYASVGVDILSLGDDIGTQNSIMIDVDLWKKWLQPRLKQVIDAARSVNPDILIFYHSCGFITPFIGNLIETGIDILNPIQPECMSFNEIHDKFGDRVSFWGTLGTQQLLPFGTKEEVFKTTLSRLKKCGKQGGIIIGPTHVVEPEVPWENLVAIKEAVKYFESNYPD